MLPIQMMPASNAKWDDLALDAEIAPAQLEQISDQIDLTIVALVALTQIGNGEIVTAAQELNVESVMADWMSRWAADRSHSESFPQLPIDAPQQPIDTVEHQRLEQVRALVLLVSHLAHQHQIVVRRNINYWEQTLEYRQSPQQSPSLAEYIESFANIYRDRVATATELTAEAISAMALNLLVELLFYGSANGHQRLWNALLQRSQSILPAHNHIQTST